MSTSMARFFARAGGRLRIGWTRQLPTAMEVEHPRGKEDMDVKRVEDWINFGRNAAEEQSLEVA